MACGDVSGCKSLGFCGKDLHVVKSGTASAVWRECVQTTSEVKNAHVTCGVVKVW